MIRFGQKTSLTEQNEIRPAGVTLVDPERYGLETFLCSIIPHLPKSLLAAADLDEILIDSFEKLHLMEEGSDRANHLIAYVLVSMYINERYPALMRSALEAGHGPV